MRIAVVVVVSLLLTGTAVAQEPPSETDALQAQIAALRAEVQKLQTAQAEKDAPSPKERAKAIRENYKAVCASRGLKFAQAEVSGKDNSVVIVCW